MKSSFPNACDFCDEFSGGSSNGFSSRYEGYLGSRILLTSASLRVIPSLGQIVEGHLLIAPSRHFRALADLPQASLQELDILYGNLRSTLTRLYGRCVFFEHGIRCEASGGCKLIMLIYMPYQFGRTVFSKSYLKDSVVFPLAQFRTLMNVYL